MQKALWYWKKLRKFEVVILFYIQIQSAILLSLFLFIKNLAFLFHFLWDGIIKKMNEWIIAKNILISLGHHLSNDGGFEVAGKLLTLYVGHINDVNSFCADFSTELDYETTPGLWNKGTLISERWIFKVFLLLRINLISFSYYIFFQGSGWRCLILLEEIQNIIHTDLVCTCCGLRYIYLLEQL